MLKIIENLPENIVGFEAHERITAEDYETVVFPYIDNLMSWNPDRKFNLIYHIGWDYEWFDLWAMYDDAKVGFKYMKNLWKMVIITDVNWIKNMASFFANHFTSVDMKVFPNNDYDKALKYVKQ